MERTFRGNWIDIPVIDYVNHVGRQSRAYWIGNRFPIDIVKGIFHMTMTGTRTCNIHSPADWSSFIDSCYSLGCANCGNEGWRAMNGHKLPFREWMCSNDAMTDRTHFTFDDAKFSNNIICTVFDTLRQKALIVDGLHRARALTMSCEKGRATIPIVIILECFGRRVDIIFPCDVHQLPLA